MAPEAKNESLLYVSDSYNNDVAVYNYRTGDQVGQLDGFDSPSGQCVDAQGDVWITNYFGGQVVEYAHAGTTPLKTLATDGNGEGCSIDPTTGDLAVGNVYSASEDGGDIQIFKNASGTPTDYTNDLQCDRIYAPGYDDRGDLYFEASSGSYNVCELAAHSLAIKPVTFHKTIDTPGSIMWDGAYIAITVINVHGQPNTAIYEAKRSAPYDLKVVGSTLLSDTCRNENAAVVQPFIVGNVNTPENREQGHTVVGANYSCVRRFDYWHYPAGGNPARHASAPGDVGGECG
jgi:hypothetical protein